MDDLQLRLELALMLGPSGKDALSGEQLERAWRVYGKAMTEHLQQHPKPGLRPWGFWMLEHGLADEPSYQDGVVWLVEHGLLTDRELREIRERANAAAHRLATLTNINVSEHEAAVALWEAVEHAITVNVGNPG